MEEGSREGKVGVSASSELCLSEIRLRAAGFWPMIASSEFLPDLMKKLLQIGLAAGLAFTTASAADWPMFRGNPALIFFTDPPYDKKSVDLYRELAELAARVLKPGGWLLTYSGMAQMPQTLSALCVDGLIYGWTFCVLHSGGDLRFRKFKLQSAWKPVFGFFKPPLSVYWEWFKDVVSGGKEKDSHEWQQAEAEAAYFIERMCPQHGLVCDPFCGSGTTLAAAKSLGRKWLGCEVNEEHAETARGRVE